MIWFARNALLRKQLVLNRLDASKKNNTSGVVFLVGVTGFEPATFYSRSKRATKLRYTPTFCNFSIKQRCFFVIIVHTAVMTQINTQSVCGANERDRTADLFITNEPLYRLSYIGMG